jgi:phosphoglycerate dehydrogenase-like enzyme
MNKRHPVLYLTDRGKRHQRAALSSASPELDVTMLRKPSQEKILKCLPGVEFLISERAGVIDAEMINTGKRLRLIQRLGSLTHDIDLEAARVVGIPVSAWPVHSCIMVAEHMVMQILALAKRLNEVSDVASRAADWGQPSRRTDEDTFAYDWSGRENLETIYQRTAGILGFGEIGAELARRLRCFAPSRVLYHKRNRLPQTVEEELGISYASLHTLLSESDYLCNLLPYSSETELLIDANFLSRMKHGAFLASCGSGSVIDEAALAETLRTGQVAGAALDTFEWEPIQSDNPLLPLARDPRSNVLLTPHTAAGSRSPASIEQSRAPDYENIRRILEGKPLQHRIA